MSARTWIFLINTFEVNTSGSNVKMLTLSTDTDSKLSNETTDPDIQSIYNAYHPVYTAYLGIMQNYAVVTGERQGNTLSVEDLLNETLLTELRKWEAAVRTVYVEDSPQEVAIFPNKRAPFINGTYESRINTVGALALKLLSDPLFATLAPQVQSFYNLLLSTRDAQQQSEGQLGLLSDAREAQRILLAEALYGIVLGQLMKKFRHDPAQIERFFMMSLLRDTGEEVLLTIDDEVAPLLTKSHTPIPEGTQRVRMTAFSGTLEFGRSLDGTVHNGNTTTLTSGNVIYDIEDFNSAGTFFMVRNQHATENGQYRIEFLK